MRNLNCRICRICFISLKIVYIYNIKRLEDAYTYNNYHILLSLFLSTLAQVKNSNLDEFNIIADEWGVFYGKQDLN